MPREKLNAHEKAFRLNMDSDKYGTIAEIGAGQEVARWFFRVGGAAGTIAKSMSAYDMTVSDAIYGESKRYVSRERLNAMLDYEYGLLEERLTGRRGASAQFFAFANTVAARSYARRDDETHGWMGVRFQHRPGVESSHIVIHVRLLDAENVQQQEAVGVLGVNLIYGGFQFWKDPGSLISSLLDDLSMDRIEVNLIRCMGPAFEDVDQRLLALELVARRLTEATMFRSDGEPVDAGELIYKKPLLVARGSFRPVTITTVEMIDVAKKRFLGESDIEEDDLVIMAEMALRSLTVGEELSPTDFLHRVDTLSALGMNVLITNAYRYFRLASYLFQHTKRKIGVVMGLPTLQDVFQPGFYADLEGGILEAFGRLFKNDLRFYVYPIQDPETGRIITAEELEVESRLRHLHAYLVENHLIEGLPVVDRAHMRIFPNDVLKMIQSGDRNWEELVPGEVVELIKARRLFGYRAPAH